LLEAAGLGEERLLREIRKRLDARITKYFKDVSLGEHTDNAVRMRATELLADLLGKRRTDINLHSDLVEIIPAPRPEDAPADDA
jgi:2-phospho-L-lactate guanylyltransferase (CobY/MobA/RfbA family)